MAGPTAKNYSVAPIRQGAGDIWVIGTPPTDTQIRLTLATDGTPDATAHPQSICLGLTEGGITTTLKPKHSDIVVDQAETAVDKYLAGMDAMIEATLTQQSVDLLQNILSTGVYSTTASPGFKQLTFGGISNIGTVCVAAISPNRSAAGLYVVTVLYKVASAGGITILNARDKKSTHKVQFNGMSDLARTAGKQIGVHYETL